MGCGLWLWHSLDFSLTFFPMLVTKLWLPNVSNRGVGIINLGKLFSKFYSRHYELISKYDTVLKTLLLQSPSKPEFYGELVYKFRNLNFLIIFVKFIFHKRKRYNIDVLKQSYVCFSAHRGSTGGFLQYSSGVVCQPRDLQMSQQVVSVESSSLLHYRLYLWFICCPQCYMDELEDLHADRTNICFTTMEAEGEG